MQINVRIVSQYGQQRIFPDCPTAELFCSIAGSKTLTDGAIRDIKALGYSVNVVQDVRTL